MGSGIAQVTAQAGYATIQFDLNEDMLKKSKTTITASVNKLLEKNKISEEEKNKLLNVCLSVQILDHVKQM